jgi:hypothetical protein
MQALAVCSSRLFPPFVAPVPTLVAGAGSTAAGIGLVLA